MSASTDDYMTLTRSVNITDGQRNDLGQLAIQADPSPFTRVLIIGILAVTASMIVTFVLLKLKRTRER
jgi:hypothetical protein